ncbi:MAG: universal stress protein [Rhizobiaceae bacterium]
MYKHILVPVVFDHNASVQPAVDVSRKLMDDDAKMTLLHVVEQPPSYAATMIPPKVFEESVEHARAEIKRLSENEAKGATPVVITGHASRAIMDYAQDNGCDCIVIASHEPGLEDYFLGSTAARVVRHSRCNVHVLR